MARVTAAGLALLLLSPPAVELATRIPTVLQAQARASSLRDLEAEALARRVPRDPSTTAPAAAEPLEVAPPAAPPPAPAPVALSIPQGPVELDGCPPPPPPPPTGPPGPPIEPWHPAVLIPEVVLPVPLTPEPWTSDLSPIDGKGMWLWQIGKTEDGDIPAIVDKAAAAGLDHLWVRVGDSRDGFYAADVLDQLVPLAHARGMDVIGWGFPFMWDPVYDAAWSAEAIAWRAPNGDRLDGFSPDIEMATEGVQLSTLRTQVYLGLVRSVAADLPVIATVYPAVDWLWGDYPYEAMVPYVDAFAPMAYWGCKEPGAVAQQSLDRLSSMRPVHLIGQAYVMGGHGRQVAPSAAETLRFLDVAERGGAVGASFWVWQLIGHEQWDAMVAYPWGERALSPTGVRGVAPADAR